MGKKKGVDKLLPKEVGCVKGFKKNQKKGSPSLHSVPHIVLCEEGVSKIQRSSLWCVWCSVDKGGVVGCVVLCKKRQWIRRGGVGS